MIEVNIRPPLNMAPFRVPAQALETAQEKLKCVFLCPKIKFEWGSAINIFI